MAARIACVDLDTFFVSVERLLEPRLRGVPVVVGAVGWRGVVTSASYEVRALGVKSGMPIAQARRLAPDAVYLPPRHGVYGDYAAQVREILEEGTDAVATASIDEFFVDFRGTERLWRTARDVDDDAAIERRVRELREAVAARVGLPCSAGIGATRAIAKMASKQAKPHVGPHHGGVRMVRAGEELAFVSPQPVSAYPGLGPVTATALIEAGVHTLGDLLSLGPGPLRMRFGPIADRVRHGIESRPLPGQRDRPAFHEHDPVGSTVGSISNERTFHADVGDRQRVEDQVRTLVERVCWRARRRGVVARTVTLKLRLADFDTCTRGRSGPATADDASVLAVARQLLDAAWTRSLPVRLVGIALSNLEPAPAQLALPLAAPGRPPVERALDAVRERFGFDAIRLGSTGRTSWVA
ncbi:MAG: DNA polymerase IV [Myxococcota bacterium]